MPTDNFKVIISFTKITKKGSNVRIDMNIKSKSKGMYSILVKEINNDLSIFKIDHEKRQVITIIKIVQ